MEMHTRGGRDGNECQAALSRSDPDDATAPSPLAVPFVALGGAAGWLWRDVLGSRFIGGDVSRRSHLTVSAVAVIGGLAGALLGPSRPTEEWMVPKPGMARVVVVVFGAGFAAGMILAAFVAHDAPVGGALAGLLSAVPLIPVCWLVAATQLGLAFRAPRH